MRLLDRYLLRELLLPLGFCLGGFLTFWAAFDLFEKLGGLQKAKLHGVDVLELYLMRTPEILVVILPVSLLLALLYALTHHARFNEITAMRAAGISLWRVSAPYLGVGFLLSVGLLVINEIVVPETTLRAEDIKTRRVAPNVGHKSSRLVTNFGFSNARARRTWQIATNQLDTGEMWQVKVMTLLPDNTLRWLIAERGIYTNGVWAFINATELQQVSPTNTMLVPFVRTNYLARPEFTETPADFRDEYTIAGQLSLRSARRADIPLADILGYVHRHPNLTPTDRAWILTKLHGRIATPWTCFVVVLIAIPFGAPSGRRNIFVGVASSIFLCFAYFVVQQVGLACGSGGLLPPWIAAWLPNIVFGGTALFLITRVR